MGKSYKHFVFFRSIFALYLISHFIGILPYAEEIFGNDIELSMISNPKLLPTASFLNMFDIIPDGYIKSFVWILLISSVCLLLNFKQRICGGILLYGWSILLCRNVFISNPGIPYVGLLMLFIILLPDNENEWTQRPHLTRGLYWLGWIIMMSGYTISGLHKLQSPSWVDGTALSHILSSPIARNTFLLPYLKSLPSIFWKIGTIGSLGLEITSLFFGTLYYLRKYYWGYLVLMHIGVLLMINFTDLTLGMLMIHIYTFDPEWFL